MTPFTHKRVANDPTTNWPALFLTAILQLNGRTRCIQQTLQPASVGDDAVSTSYHGWLTCHMMDVSILERPYLQLMIPATHDTGVNEWHWSRKAIMQDWRYSIHHGWCIAMALLKDDQQWYVTFTVTAEHESAAATTMPSIDQQYKTCSTCTVDMENYQGHAMQWHTGYRAGLDMSNGRLCLWSTTLDSRYWMTHIPLVLAYYTWHYQSITTITVTT